MMGSFITFSVLSFIFMLSVHSTVPFPIDLPSYLNSSPLENAVRGRSVCSEDDHCKIGYFCNSKTKACISCYNDECKKLKRLPGSTKCIKSRHDCGDCFPGYVLKHGHCQAVKIVPTRKSVLHEPVINRNSSTAFTPGEPFPWSFAMMIIAVLGFIGFAVTFAVWPRFSSRVIRTEFRRNFRGNYETREDEVATAPPLLPYNPDYRDSDVSENFQLTTFANLSDSRKEQENRQTMAVPFDFGLFSTPPISGTNEAAPPLDLNPANEIEEIGFQGVLEDSASEPLSPATTEASTENIDDTEEILQPLDETSNDANDEQATTISEESMDLSGDSMELRRPGANERQVNNDTTDEEALGIGFSIQVGIRRNTDQDALNWNTLQERLSIAFNDLNELENQQSFPTVQSEDEDAVLVPVETVNEAMELEELPFYDAN